jgi:hypothetical protein
LHSAVCIWVGSTTTSTNRDRSPSRCRIQHSNRYSACSLSRVLGVAWRSSNWRHRSLIRTLGNHSHPTAEHLNCSAPFSAVRIPRRRSCTGLPPLEGIRFPSHIRFMVRSIRCRDRYFRNSEVKFGQELSLRLARFYDTLTFLLGLVV